MLSIRSNVFLVPIFFSIFLFQYNKVIKFTGNRKSFVLNVLLNIHNIMHLHSISISLDTILFKYMIRKKCKIPAQICRWKWICFCPKSCLLLLYYLKLFNRVRSICLSVWFSGLQSLHSFHFVCIVAPLWDLCLLSINSYWICCRLGGICMQFAIFTFRCGSI